MGSSLKKVAVVLCCAVAFGCSNATGPKGEKGSPGEPGATGLQGPPGVVDYSRAATKREAGRLLEVEDDVAASVDTGEKRADPTASNGGVRIATAGAPAGPSGRLWTIDKATVGDALGIGRTRVLARVKVSTTTSTAPVAELSCFAVRLGATTEVPAGATVTVRPNLFAAPNTWMQLELSCDFLPDDSEQRVTLENVDPTVAELAVDYVRLDPVSDTGPRLPRKLRQRASADVMFPNTDDSCGLTAGSPWTPVPGMAISFSLPAPTEVEVATSGSLSFDIGDPTPGLHCAFRYVVDGQLLEPSHEMFGHWMVATSGFSWAVLGTDRRIQLSAGAHTISVEGRSALCRGAQPDKHYCGVGPDLFPELTVVLP